MDAYPHPGEAQPRLTAPSCRHLVERRAATGLVPVFRSACEPRHGRRARSYWLHGCRRTWTPSSSPFAPVQRRWPQASTASMATGAMSIAWPANPRSWCWTSRPSRSAASTDRRGTPVSPEVTSAGVRVRVQSDRDAVKSDVVLPLSAERQSRQAETGCRPRGYCIRGAEAAGLTRGHATPMSRGRGSISAPAREAPCGRRAVRPG